MDTPPAPHLHQSKVPSQPEGGARLRAPVSVSSDDSGGTIYVVLVRWHYQKTALRRGRPPGATLMHPWPLEVPAAGPTAFLSFS